MPLIELVEKLFGIKRLTEEQSNSITDELSKIKENYLDCKSCTDEYNCCKNISSYSPLELKTNEQINEVEYFPKKIVKDLVNNKKLIIDSPVSKLKTSCPMLSETGCLLDEQNKPKPVGCKQFPLFYSTADSAIVIDNRCYSVQQKFDELINELSPLTEKYLVSVRVLTKIYDRITKDEYFELVSVNKFKKYKESKDYSVNLSL